LSPPLLSNPVPTPVQVAAVTPLAFGPVGLSKGLFMSKVSEQISTSARKNETEILCALADVGQKNVADLIGINEATVSHWKEGKIADMAAFLAAAGLKIVRRDVEIVDPKYLDALRFLVKRSLEE